jgi:hypothetical protein
MSAATTSDSHWHNGIPRMLRNLVQKVTQTLEQYAAARIQHAARAPQHPRAQREIAGLRRAAHPDNPSKPQRKRDDPRARTR